MKLTFPNGRIGRVAQDSRRLTALAALLTAAWTLSAVSPLRGEALPLVPRIDESGWWQVAGNPDLGDLTSPAQQPVDFGVWQAADGSWQLWSCIRHCKEEGKTRLLYRWEGQRLTDRDWTPVGIAMRAVPALGESPGYLQAPYVITQQDVYYMFYGDGENICVAASDDGKQFQRVDIRDGKPQTFTEGGGRRARDPMLLNIDGAWHCYYSASKRRRRSDSSELGAMFVRTSNDLLDWSTSRHRIVLSGGSPGLLWYQAECPYVVYHRGYYYLFRTSIYKDTPTTTVYRSDDPTEFGIDDDSKIVAVLPVAAPEVIIDDGQYWIAALNSQLDGIRITSLSFAAE